MTDDELEEAVQKILDDNRVPAKQAFGVLSMMAMTASDAMNGEDDGDG